MMRTIAAAAAFLLASSVALAQSTTPRTTFVAVDGVRMEEGTVSLLVTGVLEGATSATEVRFRFPAGIDLAECRRWALVAMSKPGQYRLSFRATYVGTAVPPYWYGRDCFLERVAP